MRFIFFIFFSLSLNISFSQEICNNAIDDDGDGLIDLNDSLDCTCVLLQQPPSLIPNPSFEASQCCPSSQGQLTCADTWIQAATGTSDYFNLCNYTHIPSLLLSPPQFPIPGNGNGYIGLFMSSGVEEYIGACLNDTLFAGTSYTISFYTAYAGGGGSLNADLAIYGTTDCSDLPWNSLFCPIGFGNWQLLSSQAVTYTNDGAWQQVSVTFIPAVDITAISLGGVCNGNLGILNYYYFDELQLNASNLSNNISDLGRYCDSNLVLILNASGSSNFQWYRNGVALIGENNDTLNVSNYLPGDYTIIFDQSTVCKSLDYTIDPPVYPNASVNSVIDSLCVGENAVLQGDSSSTITSFYNWRWDLQNGSAYINTFNITEQFLSPGNYNIEFFVESNLGCKDSILVPVTVFALPDAQAEVMVNGTAYQPAEGENIFACNSDSIYFSSLSNVTTPNTISNYEWDFGDFNISNLENPSHKFTNTGLYTVKLKIETDKGCVDSLSFTIDVLPNPQADFIFQNNNCEGEIISFTNTSTINIGSINSYEWDFDDQNQSGGLNPQHQYNTPGTYDIQLIVESDQACKDSITQSVTIHPKPIANFLISGYCQADTIDFADQSMVSTGTVDTWQWNFGDGASSNVKDTSHFYSLSDSYLIQLVVETDQGCRDTLDSLYTVFPSPIPDFQFNDQCEDENIIIINNSTIASGTMSYSWTFQNSINSTLSNPPAFSYPDSGQYSALLELTSDQGCTSSQTKLITIHPLPIAYINENPITGCDPFEVKLTNFQDQNITSCVWDFGNGVTIEGCGLIRSTFNKGSYDVKLTVYSSFDCESSISKNDFIKVVETPVAAFNYSPNVISVKNNIIYFNNESIGASDFIWDFGSDLGTSNEENPELILPKIATGYTINLTAISADGLCEDVTNRVIKVFDELIFYVPNSFTPDNNGFNETFTPVMTSGFDIYSYQLTVFNRWGEILFISKDPKIGWDGTYNGTPVSVGTYLWQIDYYAIATDEGSTERGTINLIR